MFPSQPTLIAFAPSELSETVLWAVSTKQTGAGSAGSLLMSQTEVRELSIVTAVVPSSLKTSLRSEVITVGVDPLRSHKTDRSLLEVTANERFSVISIAKTASP